MIWTNLIHECYELIQRLSISTVRLWAFGMLIGNTDMHHGNLSFISSHGRPYQLALKSGR